MTVNARNASGQSGQNHNANMLLRGIYNHCKVTIIATTTLSSAYIMTYNLTQFNLDLAVISYFQSQLNKFKVAKGPT